MIEVLGLLIGGRLCIQQHVGHIVKKARIRLGLLRRASGFARGLESNVLRMTADALVVYLLRYGLSITGSMAYEQMLSRLDTAVILQRREEF